MNIPDYTCWWRPSRRHAVQIETSVNTFAPNPRLEVIFGKHLLVSARLKCIGSGRLSITPNLRERPLQSILASIVLLAFLVFFVLLCFVALLVLFACLLLFVFIGLLVLRQRGNANNKFISCITT